MPRLKLNLKNDRSFPAESELDGGEGGDGLAISMETELSAQARPGLVQRLQPRADFAGRDVGLLQ
jgi:hypothetical protein